LKAGDIIIAVNGTNLDDRHNLTALLDQHAVGDTVKLKISRDGKDQTKDIKLEEAPAPTADSNQEQQ